MQRLNRFLIAAAMTGITGTTGLVAQAHAQGREFETQTARASTRGRIIGFVSDERGGPLAGAMVTALGQTQAATVTDLRGRFTLEALPIGEYVVQARLTGFASSRREFVRVGAASTPEPKLQLRRLDSAVSPADATQPVMARPIVAAGIELPSVTLSDQPEEKSADAGRDDHPHTELAWRLRHGRRSILKDASPVVTVVDRDSDIAPSSVLERAMDSAVGLAATLFADLPFSGEVNLLTTGAFGPWDHLFSGDMLPRGVMYLSIGAPTAAGDWSARAAMSQGDLSSWIVAGAFTSRGEGAHAYDVGVSYSTQAYLGANPAALVAVTDGSRNVGELHGFDRWEIGRLSVDYGARYAWYDYLGDGGWLSPRLGVTVEPVRNTRVIAAVSQRMIAPGAEEFLASDTPGPWIPPERTFAPLSMLDGGDFRVERARTFSVGVEHQFDGEYLLGLRRFYQDVNDQLVTLFGLDLPNGPRSAGHYYVATAGAVDAEGWAFRFASPPGRRLRGAIDYSVIQARWSGREDPSVIGAWAPGAVRPAREDLHDVTTSVVTEIPETATRVFVLYRINSGFTRPSTALLRPGLDGRFDLQVNQALPFGPGGTRWEVLVGVRNLFRDPHDPGSVYDELLVVRPPKRVVGGVLVRF
ncbi:MAG TPA: TonB-dependent receptor [Vicinamibacterales bacterium]|nr:TonB-dependent receptor [Vicinamibacterales bacterium]